MTAGLLSCKMPTDTSSSWYSWQCCLCTQQEPHKTWVWLGLSFGSWKGKKLEFSDTLALRKCQCGPRDEHMCPLLRSSQDTWNFRIFFFTLTNCVQEGVQNGNCRHQFLNREKALERFPGWALAAWLEKFSLKHGAEVGTGKASEQVIE